MGFESVGWQREKHGRTGRVGEGGVTEKAYEQEIARAERRYKEDEHARPENQQHAAPRPSHGPTARNPETRESTTEKVSEVRRHER